MRVMQCHPCSVQAYVAAFLQRDQDDEPLMDEDDGVEEVVLEDRAGVGEVVDAKTGATSTHAYDATDPARLLHKVGTFAQVRHFQEASVTDDKKAFVLLYGHRRLRRLRTVRIYTHPALTLTSPPPEEGRPSFRMVYVYAVGVRGARIGRWGVRLVGLRSGEGRDEGWKCVCDGCGGWRVGFLSERLVRSKSPCAAPLVSCHCSPLPYAPMSELNV